ncbi:hypothetical protein PZA11_003115 [Diplocarpon coronariae]|uniref:Uncharacterized protein n=1 Tax=Diplocarpon coronariae TaxID=2795749 RepID=A0A218ZAZ1_9HELO|nr:hypothetical protein B2J93_5979 [Marssonina coronariae]
MSPIANDRFCSEFSTKNKVSQIAVDHPKSPKHPFIAAIQPVTEISKEMREGGILPFDKKAAIGGFRDPLLSIAFAPRDRLPPELFIIERELNMLRGEAELMAKYLARFGTNKRVGTGLVWEQNGAKWEKILGEGHAVGATPASGAKAVRVA